MSTQAPGIFQSDIIIRTALMEALADLRRNPWLLDYVFASLRQDELTRVVYGEREIETAKRWFLRTDVPVFMVTRQGEPQLPGISIELQESVETEQTLGDVNFQPTELVNSEWPILAGPFTPVEYDGGTGRLVLPSSIGEEVVVVPGMIVVDRVGGQYPIVSIDAGGVVFLVPDTVADFSGAMLRGATPRLVAHLESVVCRETYLIGCHVQGKPIYLTYLHSIVVFALWRYKQVLLEARGYERSVLSSTRFERNHGFSDTELAYSRYVSVTGYVRQYWPKLVTERIGGVDAQPTFGIEGSVGPGVTEAGRAGSADAVWLADVDAIGLPRVSSQSR